MYVYDIYIYIYIYIYIIYIYMYIFAAQTFPDEARLPPGVKNASPPVSV